MSRSAWLTVAFLMLLAALPAISLGASRDVPALWWAGLALLLAGALLPPVLRLVGVRPAPPPREEVGESPC
jgi:hypothetical protein